MTHPLRRRFHAPLLALLVLLTGCGTSNLNLVSGESQRGAYSWAQQVELGQEADQQIIAQYGLLDNAQVNQYVEAVGEQVLAQAFDAIQRSVDAGEVEVDATALAEIREAL